MAGVATESKGTVDRSAVMAEGATESKGTVDRSAVMNGGATESKGTVDRSAVMAGGSTESKGTVDRSAVMNGGATESKGTVDRSAVMAGGATESKGTVCVTGASGYVGSWLVMRLLQSGYSVNATVRDPENTKKVKHLLELPGASPNLKLWKADLVDEGSFDEPIKGCVGVFHVATPMDFECKDPEREVIKPTIDGMLNVLNSCKKAQSTVKRVVFTSSAGTVNVQRNRISVYDEDDWSDVDFCRDVKMTGWMYFVSKTLSEKAAWAFAKQNNIDFISIIPTLVNGPFIIPSMPPSMLTALALVTRNEPHYSILNPVQFVHLDDLCMAHILLFEHPKAQGRYICSSHEITLPDLAHMLRKRHPQYDVPTEFQGVDVAKDIITLSSKKLMHLGFEFKYSLEDMFDGAIQCCREKKLIPIPTQTSAPTDDGKTI